MLKVSRMIPLRTAPLGANTHQGSTCHKMRRAAQAPVQRVLPGIGNRFSTAFSTADTLKYIFAAWTLQLKDGADAVKSVAAKIGLADASTRPPNPSLRAIRWRRRALRPSNLV
jgi:hypothetical protein